MLDLSSWKFCSEGVLGAWIVATTFWKLGRLVRGASLGSINGNYPASKERLKGSMPNGELAPLPPCFEALSLL